MTKRAQVGLRTPQEARDWLESHGVSVAEFARRHGLNRHHVSDALRGKTKGRRGLAHDAAVALGIKKGVRRAEAR